MNEWDFDQIFTDADVQSLQEQGLMKPCDSSGFVRIHKRRLHALSDREYDDLPLPGPGVSVPDSAFSRIPHKLRSQATLEYLGYSQEKAREIWMKWDNWWDDCGDVPLPRDIDPNPSGGLQMTFLEFATGPVSTYSGVEDAASGDDQEWYRCMNAYGIGEELQRAIMHPDCENIRLTESCRFWVRDTFDLRFGALSGIHDASVERTEASDQTAPQPLSNPSQN